MMPVGSLVMVHAPDWKAPCLGIVTRTLANDWRDVFVFRDFPCMMTCGDSPVMADVWCEPHAEVSR